MTINKNFEKMLIQTEKQNSNIEIIQEVIVFRCKNGVSDFFGVNLPSGNLGYDPDTGFPTAEAMATGNIEAIDISDLVSSFSYSEEDQFNSAMCNIEIANIDGLFSPKNITYLGENDRLKSYPVVHNSVIEYPNVGWVVNKKFGLFEYTSGNSIEYNPNYFKNNSSIYHPLFSDKNIIKIREAIVDKSNDKVYFDDTFLGVISIVTPSSSGGEPRLSLTCYDLLKIVQGSECNRTYISPIVDKRGEYLYDQKRFSNNYGEAPSNKLEKFANGFNPNYNKHQITPTKLTNLGDNRTWANINENGMNITPNWSTSPEPQVYISHKDGTSVDGFMVKVYNGLEPKGLPVVVDHLTNINLYQVSGNIGDQNPIKAGYKPHSDIANSNNWCCVIETNIKYTDLSSQYMLSIAAEGGISVFINDEQVGSFENGKVVGGTTRFEALDSGLPQLKREDLYDKNQASGYLSIKLTPRTFTNPQDGDKLKIIYKCGESYGTNKDFQYRSGWRNFIHVSICNSEDHTDLEYNYAYLNYREVSGPYSESYNVVTGKWTPGNSAGNLPSFLNYAPGLDSYTNKVYVLGNQPSSASGINFKTCWLINPDDADYKHTILGQRGCVEFIQPTVLGDDFAVYAIYAWKEVTQHTLKKVIEDLIIEDVLGIPRYVYSSTLSDYDNPSNNQKFIEFQKLIDIDIPDGFIDSIKLDSTSTKNCFEAIQKLLQSVRPNYKLKASPTGKIVGRFYNQKGGPIIFGIEDLTYFDYDGTPKTIKNTIKPKTDQIEDREFISLSFIGFNSNQERVVGIDSSTWRRESLINNEISIDTPGLELVGLDGLKTNNYDKVFIGFKNLSNMIYSHDDERFNLIDPNNEEVFIDKLAIYKRKWDGIKWNWDRYEFPTESSFIKVITNNGLQDGLPITDGSINHSNVLCYYFNLDDLFNSSAIHTQEAGDVIAPLLRPKVDIDTVTIGNTPEPNNKGVYQGFPLHIDYDYKLALVTSMDTPIDNTEVLTKVKVVGKSRRGYSFDILESLARQVNAGTLNANNVILNHNFLSHSKSDILKLISPKGYVANLSENGALIGYLNERLSPFALNPAKASFKLKPPSMPDEADNSMRFNGFIMGYGYSNGEGDLNEDGTINYTSNWSKLIEYIPTSQLSNKYFRLDVPDHHKIITPISGVSASRAFYFRVKVNNPGRWYEFAFNSNNADIKVSVDNGPWEGLQRLPILEWLAVFGNAIQHFIAGTVSSIKFWDKRYWVPDAKAPAASAESEEEFGDGSWVFYKRIWVPENDPWISMAVKYRRVSSGIGGRHLRDGFIDINYKRLDSSVVNWNNSSVLPGSSTWSKFAPSTVPMEWIYAGVETSMGYYQLNGINGVATSETGNSVLGGTVHNIVDYNYGYFPVFITNFNEVFRSGGTVLSMGGQFGGFGGGYRYVPFYLCTTNPLALVETYDPDTYKNIVIGDWYKTYNSGDSYNRDNSGMSIALYPSGSSISEPILFPDTTQKVQLPSGTTYDSPSINDVEDIFSNQGVSYLELDLQTERQIGEIGLLVGFAPYDLPLKTTNQEVQLKQSLDNDTSIMFPITRTKYELGSKIDDDSAYAGTGFLPEEEYGIGYENNLALINTTGGSAWVPGSGTVIDDKTVLSKTIQIENPLPDESNAIVGYEIQILAKSNISDNYIVLFDWQKVHTRAEFFKFIVDQDKSNKTYRYLNVKIRNPDPVIYESYLKDISYENKVSLNNSFKTAITGPDIYVLHYRKNASFDPDAKLGLAELTYDNVRQVFSVNPARADFRFVSINQIYIQEKDDIYSEIQAEAETTNKWYNPMLDINNSKLVNENGLIINHLNTVINDNNAGTNGECLSSALVVLNDNIRTKDSVTLNIAYYPGLKINQTVWVTMGAMGGYTEIEDEEDIYYNHPGKLMIIDKISKNHNGSQPQLQLTLRNYR